MRYGIMTESDERALRGFIYFLMTVIAIMFFAILYVHIACPYDGVYIPCGNVGFRYSPELSWYSGPIGNGCGCK